MSKTVAKTIAPVVFGTALHGLMGGSPVGEVHAITLTSHEKTPKDSGRIKRLVTLALLNNPGLVDAGESSYCVRRRNDIARFSRGPLEKFRQVTKDGTGWSFGDMEQLRRGWEVAKNSNYKPFCTRAYVANNGPHCEKTVRWTVERIMEAGDDDADGYFDGAEMRRIGKELEKYESRATKYPDRNWYADYQTEAESAGDEGSGRGGTTRQGRYQCRESGPGHVRGSICGMGVVGGPTSYPVPLTEEECCH